MRKSVKVAVLAAVAGTMLAFGGCLQQVLRQAAIEVGADLVGGFIPINLGDLLPGGNAAGG